MQNQNDKTTLVLIKQALKNNEPSQRKLYEMYYGYAITVCMCYSKDYEEAQEILNDGFVKVFRHLDTFDQSKEFRFWLRRILINTAIDYQRRYSKYQTQPLLEISHAQHLQVEAESISALSAKEILQYVQQLAPSYRMVFNLFVIEGYSHKEIGELLNISEGTSKSNLAVARTRLQKMLSAATDSQNFKKNNNVAL